MTIDQTLDAAIICLGSAFPYVLNRLYPHAVRHDALPDGDTPEEIEYRAAAHAIEHALDDDLADALDRFFAADEELRLARGGVTHAQHTR
ncbi:MAG TPA: hypothetical protein VNJ04_19585 [Gemmatimonadaceae bacterium]|nr:hypothetical protein [Gemmatimonadaceae bacterium]